VNIFTMAWRNLWRNKRRTFVTIAAMALALFVELLYSGLIVGMMSGMQEDVVELELGDLQVHAPAYLERPSLYEFMPRSDALLAHLDELGYPATPRLLGGGLAASGEFSAGVALRGIDVAREARVSRIADHVMEGAWVDPADPKGVVIGNRLARILSVGVGGEVVVLTQGADGSIANDLFIVRGVLSSVAAGTDRGAVFLLDAAFRELMVLPRGAHQVVVRRPPQVSEADAKAAVQAFEGDVRVMTWREIMPVVGQMLDSVQAMVSIMYLIVYLAVAILILNAMLMVVFERIREFGVLKAIGAGPLRVFGLILVESLLQACVALVIGVTMALPGMWFLSTKGIDVGGLGGIDMMGVAMRPMWQGIYTVETVQTPIVLLFVIVVLAVLYPALKASWIQPVQAMRHR
jgi:putative ABC transport system permease protein